MTIKQKPICTSWKDYFLVIFKHIIDQAWLDPQDDNAGGMTQPYVDKVGLSALDLDMSQEDI